MDWLLSTPLGVMAPGGSGCCGLGEIISLTKSILALKARRELMRASSHFGTDTEIDFNPSLLYK